MYIILPSNQFINLDSIAFMECPNDESIIIHISWNNKVIEISWQFVSIQLAKQHIMKLIKDGERSPVQYAEILEGIKVRFFHKDFVSNMPKSELKLEKKNSSSDIDLNDI